jgi:hypothetical protein
MPESTSEVRSGDPALKYGPSVWAGVGCPLHVPDAEDAFDGGATLDDVAGDAAHPISPMASPIVANKDARR